MIDWRQNLVVVCAALALGAVACGSDEGSAQQENNDWIQQDAAGEESGGEDAGGVDALGRDATPPDATADARNADARNADARNADARNADAGKADTDDNAQTPFTAEGLSSRRWYGVSLLSAAPATTGSVLAVEFHEDMTVTVGFHQEVTGSWAFFGDGRVRLFDLMKGGEPNQPQQFLLDADLEGEHVAGLEIVIPDANGGQPYVLRFEQLATADVGVDDIAGNWQSDETYTGENGDTYRLAIRILAGTFGYGGYNGAYIEFISGQTQVITYDTGETFWFSVPPQSGSSVPSVAGEVRMAGDGDGYTIWAPREVTPDSGEFESVEMQQVDTFTEP